MGQFPSGVSMGRGSNPLLANQAIAQGGQIGLQGVNQSAQLQAQAGTQAAQLAQDTWKTKLNSTLAQQHRFDYLKGLEKQADANAAQLKQEQAQADQNMILGAAGTTADAGSTIFGMFGDNPPSDIRAKRNIEPLSGQGAMSESEVQHLMQLLDREGARTSQRLGGNPLDGAMRNMGAYQFEYKPEVAERIGQPPGARPGVMAQELEQDPLTRPMVRNTRQGKEIDMPTAVGTNLAMTSRLAERDDQQDQQMRALAAMFAEQQARRGQPGDARVMSLAEQLDREGAGTEAALGAPSPDALVSDEHSKDQIKRLTQQRDMLRATLRNTRRDPVGMRESLGIGRENRPVATEGLAHRGQMAGHDAWMAARNQRSKLRDRGLYDEEQGRAVPGTVAVQNPRALETGHGSTLKEAYEAMGSFVPRRDDEERWNMWKRF